MRNQPAVTSATPFDHAKYLNDLKERFARNIWKLGGKNVVGTKRYELEVEFAYAIDEIERGSIYSRGKAFERANSIINSIFAEVQPKGESK